MADGLGTPGFERLDLVRVLESAAALQEIVPDAVLVGGSAAALWANHRSSYAHDHVLTDLAERFDAVLQAVEETDGWVTNRATPGKIILGDLGGIESGVRQLIRRAPLEVTEVVLPSGHRLRVPTADEILRIKGFLVVRRNQTRDYLDVVALADRCGVAHAGRGARRHRPLLRGPARPRRGRRGDPTRPTAREPSTSRPSDGRRAGSLQGSGCPLDGLAGRDRGLSGPGRGDDPVSTGLAFRNVDASPDDPVETWPFEARRRCGRTRLPPRLAAAGPSHRRRPVGTGRRGGRRRGSTVPPVRHDRAVRRGHRPRPPGRGRRRTTGGGRRDRPARSRLGTQPSGVRHPDRHVGLPLVDLPERQGDAVGCPRGPDAPRRAGRSVRARTPPA